MLKSFFVALLAVHLTGSLAQAANILAMSSRNNPKEGVLSIAGDLAVADVDEFRAKIAPYSSGIVILRSDGGSLLAGIEIGRIIRLRNFVTSVPSGGRCASACATAWLGGSKRMMGKGALVGFHAAYTVQKGQLTESGVGNAVLGGYLSQVGLSDQAIVYITQTSPSSMTWLTLKDAERVGIDVFVFDADRSIRTTRIQQQAAAHAAR